MDAKENIEENKKKLEGRIKRVFILFLAICVVVIGFYAVKNFIAASFLTIGAVVILIYGAGLIMNSAINDLNEELRREGQADK